MRRQVLVVMVMAAAIVPHARAAESLQRPTTLAIDAQYEADLNKRADGVISALNLDDADKTERVKQAVMAQYRAIRQIDDNSLAGVAPEDKTAIAKAKEDAAAAKKPLHDAFLAKLSQDLDPAQVEIVKDQMTYNVVDVTYNVYCDQHPQLTETQKAYILAQLKEARELAMDLGSSKEKHAVFGKAKGRINNYLAKEGYDLKKAEKEWRARLKARQNAATEATQR